MMMKGSNTTVLALLCVLHPLVSTTLAFVVPQPSSAFAASHPSSALASSYMDSVSNTNADAAQNQRMVSSGSGLNSPMGSSSMSTMSSAAAPQAPMATASKREYDSEIKSIWETSTPVIVQGNSLRTWSFASATFERVQVLMRTSGRPLNANVDLWQGPGNTPQTMGIYNEDGSLRPFSAVIETPRGSNTVAIRNTGNMEFPLEACVEAEAIDMNGKGSGDLRAVTAVLATAKPRTVQGGAVFTIPFQPNVASVQILLMTDGRPLNARIELLQGPNNNKQVLEFYSENGDQRPFFAVFETPGVGNVVRIVNTAPMEFPLTARCEPYLMEEDGDDMDGSGGWQIV